MIEKLQLDGQVLLRQVMELGELMQTEQGLQIQVLVQLTVETITSILRLVQVVQIQLF